MAERTFTLEDLRELMDPEFVNQGKINCIKHLRQMTGEGLRETKDFFEQEWLPLMNGTRTPPKEVKVYVEDTPEFHRLSEQVEQLARQVASLRTNQIKVRAAGLLEE